MIKPPIKASISIGKYEIERAALYSAAMGVREIAKLATQKAKPPATARTNTFLQITFDRVILFFSFFRPYLFLILHALYEKPQTKRNFRNKTNYHTRVRNYFVARQKEKLRDI